MHFDQHRFPPIERKPRVRGVLFGSVVVLAAALFIGGVSHGAEPGRLKARSCDTAKSRAFAANEHGRLIKRERSGTHVGEGQELLVYACTGRTRRPVRVFYCANDGCSVTDASLTGCYAAIGTHEAYRSLGQGATSVRRVDFCRRRVVVVAHASHVQGKNGGGSAAVTDVAVKRNGSTAWIWGIQRLDENRVVGPMSIEVEKLDTHGRAQLDAAPDIDPRSLALSGSRLYWLKAGGPRTGRLE